MERDGARWKWNGRATDLFQGMAARGVKGFRVRLWADDSGPHSRSYAARVIKRAAAAGRDLIVEFIPKEDSQVRILLTSRKDIFPDYNRESFEKVFSAYFTIEDRARIADSQENDLSDAGMGGGKRLAVSSER